MKLSKKQQKLIIEGHEAACPEWKGKIVKGFPKLFKEGELVGFRAEDRFWTTSFGALSSHQMLNAKKATHKEIKEHLIEEAKKRGYLGEVRIDKTPLNYKGDKMVWDSVFNGEADYYPEEDDLIVLPSCDEIYSNGKWAEIIKTITKKEAEEKLGVKIID